MWEIDLSGQIYTFLLSLLLGVVFCLVYDTIRTVELKFRMAPTAVFFTDVLYFAVIAIFDFCFFLVRTSGEIRGFVLVGQLGGFLLCKKTLSRLYGIVMLLIFKAVRWIKKWICRLILNPIYELFEKIGRFAVNLSKKSSNFFKKRLKNHKGLVYTKEKCPQDSK